MRKGGDQTPRSHRRQHHRAPFFSLFRTSSEDRAGGGVVVAVVGGRGKPANIFLDTRSRLRQWCSGAHLFEAPGPCLARISRRGAEELQARAAPAGPEDAGRGLREGVPARIIVAFSISFDFPPPLRYIRLWRSTNNQHKSCAAARFALVVLRRRRVLARLCSCIYFFLLFFPLSSRRVCIFLSFQLWCHSGLPEWR